MLIYGLNGVLVCIGSEMAVKPGFTIPEIVFSKLYFVKLCVWLSNSNRIACV